VNYNGARFLQGCLSSLSAQTYSPYEIILVDNASSDDSCAFVEKNFPNVKLIRSETNVGFAAGNNLGLQNARDELSDIHKGHEHLIATLNTDTRVEPDYLEKLSAPLHDARVGACAPLMLEMERPAIVDAAGIRVDFFGFAWNIGAGDSANKFATMGEVYGACAGAALYRRAMLDQVGFFDDAYFGFYEDADLAWRAHHAGWITMFVPQARVFHMHSASFGKSSSRKTYLLARNRWWTIFKNYPTPQFYFALPILFMLDAVSLVQAARRGFFQEAWRGRVDAWRGRKKMWARRQTSNVSP
jgi:hypothetical protein